MQRHHAHAALAVASSLLLATSWSPGSTSPSTTGTSHASISAEPTGQPAQEDAVARPTTSGQATPGKAFGAAGSTVAERDAVSAGHGIEYVANRVTAYPPQLRSVRAPPARPASDSS